MTTPTTRGPGRLVPWNLRLWARRHTALSRGADRLRALAEDLLAHLLHWSGGLALWRTVSRRKRGALILTYHGLGEAGFMPDGLFVSPRTFERQLAYLCRHYRVIPLSELVQRLRAGGTLRRDTVVLTFDDGYRNNYDVAFPLLQRYGCPATVFVTSDPVEYKESLWLARLFYWLQVSPTRWLRVGDRGRRQEYELADAAARKTLGKELVTRVQRADTRGGAALLGEIRTQLGVADDPIDRLPMLTWEETRTLSRAGVAIGGHTATHPCLAALSDEELRAELIDSRNLMEARLGQPVTLFAYPFGTEKDTGARVAQAVREAGYECGCTMVPGRVTPASDPFALPRIGVRDVSLPRFALQLLRT